MAFLLTFDGFFPITGALWGNFATAWQHQAPGMMFFFWQDFLATLGKK